MPDATLDRARAVLVWRWWLPLIFAVVALVSLSPQRAFAGNQAGPDGWEWQNPLPQGNTPTALCFVDEDLGWAVSGKTIIKTVDGGSGWELQYRGDLVPTSLYFSDALHGWAGTSTGSILRTTDGGQTWDSTNAGGGWSVGQIQFIDDNVGWAVPSTATGTILRTVDGGDNWTPAPLGVSSAAKFHFGDYANGWAVAAEGAVVRTTDGGVTWSPVADNLAAGTYKIQVLDDQVAFAVTGSSVYRTLDGGKTWTRIYYFNGVSSSFNGAYFADANNGFLVFNQVMGVFNTYGYNWVSRTTDGCATTTGVAVGYDAVLNVYLLDPSHVWVVGYYGATGGTVRRSTDGGATWSTSGGSTSDYRAVWFTDAQNGCAVGTQGSILRTSDGGETWVEEGTRSRTADLRDLCFTDSADGWVLRSRYGYGHGVLRTSDGGKTWATSLFIGPVSSGYDFSGYSAIDAVDEDTAWVAGTDVRKTTDGGATWLTLTTRTSQIQRDVDFVDANVGWTVGDGGTIQKTVDGGATWVLQGCGTTASMSRVRFLDRNVGWVTGGGRQFKTTDGGATWSKVNELGAAPAFDFIDESAGWAVGGGTAYRTLDGGKTWSTYAVDADSITSHYALNASNVWAVGNKGAIVHYSTDSVDRIAESVHRVTTRDSSCWTPISGVSILTDDLIDGGLEGLTDALGRLDIDPAGLKTVTAQKPGYRVSKMILDLEPKRVSTLFMDEWVADGKPYLSMAAFKESSAEYKDAIRQNVYIAEGSGDRHELICDADWNGNGAGEYTLYQENVRISNTTGRFSFVPGKTFQPGKAVYLRLKAANGVTSHTKLRFAITSTAGTDWPGGVKIGEETGFEIGDDVPVFGGLKAELGFDMIPVSVVREGNTFKAGFGVTDAVKMKENWRDFTGSVDKARNKVKAVNLYQRYVEEGKATKPHYSITEKWKTEPEVVGYAEGVIDPDGTFRVTKGYILASIDGKKSWGRQYIVSGVPVYVEAMAGCELDLETGIQKILADDGTLVCYSDLTVTPKGSLGAGVGVKGAASVGAEGTAKLPIFISGQQDYMKVDATGSLKIKVSLLYVFKAEKVIAKKTWPLWDSREGVMTASAITALPRRDLFEKSSFTLAPRVGQSTVKAAGVTVGAVDLTDPFAPLVSPSMPSAQPQMIRVGEKLIAVYQTDDPARSDLNRTKLCYSVEEDGAWSEPVAVWDNGAPDGSAALASDGESTWLVWQKADRALALPSGATEGEMIEALSSAQEIAAARWDGAMGTFVEAAYVTENDTLDVLPAVTVAGGVPRLAWVNNSSSDAFGRDGLNRVRSATRTAGGWSANDVASTTAPVLELAVGGAAGGPAFAYTIDKDGDLNTATDIELMLATSASTQALSDNVLPETGPRFHGARLYWYDGTLRSCDPTTRIVSSVFADGAPMGSAYSIVSDGSRDGVAWLSSEPETGTVVLARWFEGQESGHDFEIARTERRIDSLAVDFTDAEGWGLLANLGVEDASSIAYASVSPYPDVVLEGVSADESTRTAQGVAVQLSMRNDGQRLASGLTLKVSEAATGDEVDTVPLSSSIDAGAEIAEVVRVSIPALASETDLVFEVVCADDRYTADNRMTETLGKADIALSVTHYVLGDQAVLVSHVTNNAGTPADAVLEIREEGEAGAVIESHDLSEVDDSIGQVFTTAVPLYKESTESTPAPLAYVVEVRSDVNETITGNNVAVITAEQLSDVPFEGEVPAATPIPVEGISITTGADTAVFDAADIGSTLALSYETVPALATTQTVGWQTSDASVATVDENGVVTIVGSGSATITVVSDDGSFTDSFQISVFSDAVHAVEFRVGGEVVGRVDYTEGEFLGERVAPAPTRVGYTFAGWSLEVGGDALDPATYRILADQSLHALWVADVVAIVECPDILCSPTVIGDSVSASWGTVAGATAYQWRVNFSGAWTDVATNAATVSGLSLGSNIVEVRGVNDLEVGPAGFVVVNSLPLGLTVEPIAGSNRYSTAIEASKKAFPGGAPCVVIATGSNWPDALGGASLAAAKGGPILLTQQGALPAELLAEIERLGASEAVVLGGEAAVSASVENVLKAKLGSGNVTRIGGAGRYQTAELVAKATVDELGPVYDGTFFVATGGNFPDALGASPLAAAKGWPLLLAGPKGLSASTLDILDAIGADHALILGGTGAVSTTVEEALKADYGNANVERIAGASRYETAKIVAEYGVSSAGLGWDKVAIATGANFPDALAGGVLQGLDGSVMLLTPGTTLDNAPKSALVANKADIRTVRFLGGTGAVSQAVRDQVTTALE